MINPQSDIQTRNYDTANSKYAKVMEIPVGKYQQQIYINTFNIMFRVYWISAYGIYKFKDYSITASGTGAINFKDLTPLNYGHNVAASISSNVCTVYVQGGIQYASVQVKILQCNNPHFIKFLQHEDFKEDFSVTTAIYPTKNFVYSRLDTTLNLSDDSILNINNIGANKYIKIFEVYSTSQYYFLNGSFVLLVTNNNNNTTEGMLEVIHVKYRINTGPTTKAEISRLSGETSVVAKAEFYVTYDSTSKKIFGYMRHDILGMNISTTVLQYEQSENNAILSLINNEAAVSSVTGTLLATSLPLYLKGSKTYDPPNIVSGTQTSTTVTVTGAALGDEAKATFSLSRQGIEMWADVTSADTVTVYFSNNTGGDIDLGSGTLKVKVSKW